MRQGKEVIVVTSGAIGVGRQKLRYQQLMTSSFVNLHNKLNSTLDGKPCAAIGQSGLMTLYETLFNQLDVASAQLLVTDNDFKNPEFRHQLHETVNALLEHSVVPVFNENDAISTRKAPYKVSEQKKNTNTFADDAQDGIFWDNDSLAALLAVELKADLLLLLTDVEGLYTLPPGEAGSQIIHTYLKEIHSETVTFGDKSRVGRGGMTAKVFGACTAADAGVPVVVASGYAADAVLRVMRGEHVGTLFHRDAAKWAALKEGRARDMAVAARNASRKLQALSTEERQEALRNVAQALEAAEQEILAENEADIRAAEMAGIAAPLLHRLRLKPGRIGQLAEGIRAIATMKEPIAEVLGRTELAEGLELEKQTWPLGVLLVIFESRPDALPQIAALSIRSGNGLLLKGGKEASRSNTILHKVITEALPSRVGPHLVGLVTTREAIADLLKLDDVIDLVIPRGSNELVSHVKNSTKIAVLGHADGVCHVYVDEHANLETAKRIVVDAKIDYPAACNAMETMLVHESLAKNGCLQELCNALTDAGVTLHWGPRLSKILGLISVKDLHKEYGELACTVETVSSVEQAIDHIHDHGSAHTDCIVTEDEGVASLFLGAVDSACVVHNASTRFSDGYRFGLGAEVGISTSRIHARGPVGVEGLLTSRWLLRGRGHVVNKDKAIKYTHRKLEPKQLVGSMASANGHAL
eukprot:SM000042S15276  [mRNA]  locus=s42:42441:48707:+ [translate_table: standard]